MISSRESLKAWLRLSLTPGVGNVTARALLLRFGLPEAVFEQSTSELQTIVSSAIGQQLRLIPLGLEDALETTWEWLQTQADLGTSKVAHKRLLTLADSDYPSSLMLTPDPPVLLYVLGQTQHLHLLSPPAHQAPRAMAVVGSRNPTPQGRLNAHDFAVHLAQAGLTVVSGLALGVDTAAHQGALKGGSPHHPLHTVAVVGTGLDRVYPHQNHALALKIAAHGLLISEYPLNTPPITSNFPQRNRLIAGLSQGCLVVEAAARSGSLITAKQALDLGKEVFAIPGSIHTTVSKGCHDLIKQGAKLVDCAQDILEELRDLPAVDWHTAPAPDFLNPPRAHEPLLENEQIGTSTLRVLDYLGQDPVGLDELQLRSGLSTSQLQAELFQLELNGALGRLQGGLYQKLSPRR
ncbi:MAG: DNA-protecting protein DprA [Limnohabitans sp.]|nr:DNA-protecting protein DprA [Limnohabitans sp.]